MGVETAKGKFGLENYYRLVDVFNGAVVIAKDAWAALCQAVDCGTKVFVAIAACNPATLFAAATSCMKAYEDVRKVMQDATEYMEKTLPAGLDATTQGAENLKSWLYSYASPEKRS